MTLETLRRAVRRAFTPPLVLLAALWLLIEEFLWIRLGALVARLERRPLIAAFEARLARLPPYAAMALFVVPTAMLVPIKLAALYLIATGRALLGIAVLVVAKLVLTAIIVRLFALCRPQLMTIAWFARLHDWVLRARDDLYGRVRAMPGWQQAQAIVRGAMVFCRRLLAELGA